LKGDNHGIFESDIPAFAWVHRRNPEKPQSRKPTAWPGRDLETL